ncbi:MAG TPA: hypothetical protein VFT59_01060 [Candidatus Saccharimonadales bacterium]|nr:hypothetical protein [Candidatus Saccharimonadales bacterium]
MVRISMERISEQCNRWFDPFARVAIFIVYFYFGILKVIDASSATPLARALTERTIGGQFFEPMFLGLAIFECLLGVMFLFPKLTKLAIPLLIIHMGIVCSPLLLVPDMAWSSFLIPSLEGQYMIKNIVIVALIVGLLGRCYKKD